MLNVGPLLLNPLFQHQRYVIQDNWGFKANKLNNELFQTTNSFFTFFKFNFPKKKSNAMVRMHSNQNLSQICFKRCSTLVSRCHANDAHLLSGMLWKREKICFPKTKERPIIDIELDIFIFKVHIRQI